MPSLDSLIARLQSDPTFAAVVGAGALVVILLLLVFWRLGRRSADLTSRRQEVEDMRNQLAQAYSHQVETMQRVERSLREQEVALVKVVDERLDRTEQATGQIVTDLRERLVRIDEAQKKIGDLSTQVVSLQEVLSNKQARGAFGEVQLNSLVADMLPGAAYELQATLSTGVRVDCLLKLPKPALPIPVDAKFPLESYRILRDVGADVAMQAAAQRGFQQAMRKHIGDIRDKYLNVPGETGESALLFLPSEAIYAELHANHPGVIDESYRARVWIVSPTTMMATLNTVNAVLKDARMREQTGAIQKLVGLLLEDLRRLDERVEKLKTHFDQTGKDLRLIETSVDQIKGRGERIVSADLGSEQPALTPPKA
jgi:DNA recombination protein RmuC